MNTATTNLILTLAIPFLLIPSTALVFSIAANILGKETGYLAGFLFYWTVWCFLIPLFIVDWDGYLSLFMDKAPLLSRPNWLVAALWAFITLVSILMYGKDFLHASPRLILIAIPAATINGVCEEILWRGLYIRMFPDNFWLAVIFPSIGFALWHLVPLSVFSVGNKWKFILSTFFLGLAYGFIAYKTGSIMWTAISHGLNGILALGGAIAPSILKTFSNKKDQTA